MIKFAAVIILTSALLTGNHNSSADATTGPVTVGSATVSNSAGLGK
jgi:hypothetical protein